MFDSFKQKLLSFLDDEKKALSENKKQVFNCFFVKRVDNGYRVSTVNRSLFLSMVEKYKSYLTELPFYNDLLEIIKEKELFLDNIDEVIDLCYFDLIIYNLMEASGRESFLNMGLISFISSSKVKRARLFDVNKTSVFFDKETPVKKYRNIVEKGFDFVEIDPSISLLRVSEVAEGMRTLAKEKNIDDFNISLRIKKLGHYKAKGFYSKETNTMFIDPRHMNVWRHEMGHYFVAKMNVDTEDEELFADNF